MPVLAVVDSALEAGPLIRWGVRFARALETDLQVLHVARTERASEPVEVDLEAPSDDPALTAISSALAPLTPQPPGEQMDESEAAGEPGTGEGGEQTASPETPALPQPAVAVRSVSAPDPLGSVLAEIDRLGADLVLAAQRRPVRGKRAATHVGVRLLERAPCDTMLLRTDVESGKRCRRILVPAAGGPHSLVALRLAERVAVAEGCTVTALYVEPEIGDEADEVGTSQIEKVLKKAGVKSSEHVVPRVAVADSVARGIAAVAREGADLLLVGASERSFIRRTLFGTVPETLLRGPEGMAVAIVKRARPLAVRTRESIEQWIGERVPQLHREDRVALFERLQDGSRWTFDFAALICLSTAIASLGLIQSSAAVVIGAMLVAPLLTPMLGAGLALVQGNIPLVREAARSIILGFLMALAIGVLFGGLTPIRSLTPELLARGAPNLLDLIIALLSGAAAAYAVARPNLSGALPGVAIAAALVPPIATAGISLGIGEMKNAQGAAALFGTNLVAIVLGAAVALYLIGVRGFRKHTKTKLWTRRVVLALILIAVVISIPLGSVLLSRVSADTGSVPEEVVEALRGRIESQEGMDLLSVTPPNDDLGTDLEVVVVSASPAPPELAGQLAALAAERLGEGVRVRLVTRLASVGDSRGP